MAADQVFHAAIALIKVNGKYVSKLKSINFSENFQRLDVQGIGTIFSSEVPVTKFTGTLSASKMSTSYKDGVIPDAVRRVWKNVASQALTGQESFEDQLVLGEEAITLELYRKVTDVIAPDGTIKPKVIPYAIIRKFYLESASCNVSEGSISGEDVSGKFLEPIIFSS